MKTIIIVFATALLISFQSMAQKENVIKNESISVPASQMNTPTVNGVYPSPDGNNVAEHKRHYETTRMNHNGPKDNWINPEILKPEKEGIRESTVIL